MTAKVRTSDMTFDWSRMRNRLLRDDGVENLVQYFESFGVLRDLPENFMRAVVSRDELEAVRRHLLDESPDELLNRHPSFASWPSVNGTRIEVIAGHHRAAALNRYLARRGDADPGSEEHWWVCELYDRERLPDGLRIQIQNNIDRNNKTLESHGCTWRSVAHLLSQSERGGSEELWEDLADLSRQPDPAAGLEAIVCHRLGIIGNQQKVPVRRLLLLWKNDTWRPVVTEWCNARIGEDLFNISRWEWMMASGIEDFWLQWIRNVLLLFDHVRAATGSTFDPSLRDYELLRERCGGGSESRPTTANALKGLFYPTGEAGAGCDDGRRGFLSDTRDAAQYRRCYELFASHLPCDLFNIAGHMRTAKADGMVLAKVMRHVTQWIDPSAEKSNHRDMTKSPYRKKLVPSFRTVVARARADATSCPPAVVRICRVLGISLDNLAFTGGDAGFGDSSVPARYFRGLVGDSAGDAAGGLCDVLSIELQNDVWRKIQPRLKEWKTNNDLNRSLDDHDDEAEAPGRAAKPYCARFETTDGDWRGILDVVRQWLGPEVVPVARRPLSSRLHRTPERDVASRRPSSGSDRDSGPVQRCGLRGGVAVPRWRLKFATDVPFRSIPQLVKTGFEHLRRRTLKSSLEKDVAAHYELASDLLQEAIDRHDELCDLILIIALTFGYAKGTPFVKGYKDEFRPSGKPPNLGSERAASIVIRMLWLLMPVAFANAEADGRIRKRTDLLRRVGKSARRRMDGGGSSSIEAPKASEVPGL
ncbi:hypothetical protein CMEL01_16783 [Colletotrichum melonis]|uniref:Uncharacterized protein n=1 Tax=Colletotrichum melonis TaxID=1209925 RepID=A0AAI9XK28_9PEZI|nr:hypothetical protein CMEL01_16783 [Colletotrichum melonis]